MTRLSTHIICEIYHVTGAYLKSEVFILFRHTSRKYHDGTINQVPRPYFESITWIWRSLLWLSLYSPMPGAWASSAAVLSTAESGSIGEEIGQRFMRHLPAMIAAIYRIIRTEIWLTRCDFRLCTEICQVRTFPWSTVPNRRFKECKSKRHWNPKNSR